MKNIPAKSSSPAYKFWFSLLIGVPVAALIVFSSVLVLEKRNLLLEMEMLDHASHLFGLSGNLVHEMQKERGYTAGFIASKGKRFKTELTLQRAVTDEEYLAFTIPYLSAKENSTRVDLRTNYKPAMGELERLKDIRAAVDSLAIGYVDALMYYSRVNSMMLDSIVLVQRLTSDQEISTLYFAEYYLQQVKEKAGIQRAALTNAFTMGKFPTGEYERFLGIVSDEAYSQKLFLSMAPPDIQQAHRKVSTMREVGLADQARQTATEKGVTGDFGIDPYYWNTMQTVKIDRLNDVCRLLEERTEKAVDERHAEAKASLIIYLLVNVAVAAFALSMAVLLFRNISKRREAEEGLALHAKRMENALSRSGEVLNAITTPSVMVPFFTASSVYCRMRSMGGGDSVKWVGFRSKYAALYMHDVAGHDIEEILLNILATAMVDTLKINPEKKSASIPSVFLNKMNERLTKYCAGRPDYLTALYLLMDFEERNIRMAAAGHPKPWLINPDGTVRPVEVPAGFVLGQFAINSVTDDRYRDIAFHLETGQLLLVYSDGLMEQKDGEGTAFDSKFRKEIGPNLAGLEPYAAHELLKREFEAHLNGRAADDDVSFVFIGCRPADKYETVRFVPGSELLSLIRGHWINRENGSAAPAKQPASKSPSQSAGQSGRIVIHKLSDSYAPIIEKLKNARWTDKKISGVELAVSEMVINAIMHGNMCCDQCAVELSYILHGDELEICVTDEGSGFDSETLPQSIGDNLLQEGGRGHHMISAMSDGLYFNEVGNRCWALFQKRDSFDPNLLTDIGPERSLAREQQMYLQWYGRYSVGIKTFDDQHETLFSLINNLHAGIQEKRNREALEEALEGLAAYLKGHFASEETVMRKYGYPGYEKHKDEHNEFAVKVDEYCRHFQNDGAALSVEVLRFMVDWLKKHLNGTDKLYTRFLTEKGVK